jgi:predicted nucleic acid-binding protein
MRVARVAVDANVLIAGIIFPRWPYEVLQHALKGDFTLVLSPLVIREARRRIALQFPGFEQAFEQFLQATGYEEAPIPSAEEIAQNPHLVRDEKDIPVALSVIKASVDYFVTCDKDFTDKDETTREVRAAIPGIMLPPVFLREVMNWTSDELEQIRHRTWADFEGGS